MAAGDQQNFHAADYAVFVLSLVLTALVGLFFSFWKRKKTTSGELLVASRSMNFLPVSLSLTASLLNGIFIIGGPANTYYYGAEGTWILIGWLLTVPAVSLVVVPTFYQMGLTSAYQYLEERYNYVVRVIGSFIFGISLLLFLAVVLYAPALAFAQVTSLSLPVSIVVTGVICTIYTGLGGIKAVIWTDTIQMIILLVGLIVLCVMGSEEVGGIVKVFDVAKAGGRDNWLDFDPDPRNRHTFWGQVLGQWVLYTGILFSNQMMIQRYMTVTNVRQAQAAILMMILGACVVLVLIFILGFTMYAFYAQPGKCDPIVEGKITKGDQIVPFFLMEIIGHLHGLPGLFTAAVFAAALSSVSSAVNSLSAIVLEDFIKPGYTMITHKLLPERAATWTSIGLAFFFGFLTIGLSYSAERMTPQLIEATGIIWSLVGGPLAGVFIMGFFFPWVNATGALSGMLVSLVFSLWLGVGGIMYKLPEKALPLNLSCFPKDILPMVIAKLTPKATDSPPGGDLHPFYQISYAWYGVFSIGICIIIGNLVSIIINIIKCMSGTDEEAMTKNGKYWCNVNKDPRWFYNCADNCYCYCPHKVRECCKCGVPHPEEDGTPKITKFRIQNGEMQEIQNGGSGVANPAFVTEESPTGNNEEKL